MAVYYNEFEPYAVQWLRNLIKKGMIADGEVDERSITEVQPDDLRGFTQCHFFAGIGGWSLAARLAGWPDDRELWTGSAPCQPFSTAGKQKGQKDERHLWPVFFDLISACKPTTIMGEQVSAAIRFGWLDGVSSDLESEGYTTGSVIIPACAVNAPHKRDRLWFVGYTEHNGQPAASQHRGYAKTIQHNAQGKNRTSKPERAGSLWNVPKYIECPDGKYRRTEPGVPLLVDGLPSRMVGRSTLSDKKRREGVLSGFGNAIDPRVAAEIIKSYMKVIK